MLATVVDITERKQFEAAREDLISELERSKGELESFSYSVSHDLRSPLRAIDGFSKILLEDHAGKLDEEGKRVLNVVCRNVQKMGQLIDDLLRFSRLGRQHINRANVDMKSQAQEVFDELASDSPDRRINCRISDLPTIQGDLALLRQVWMNLIGNAVKYTRPREVAEIEIHGKVEDGKASYSIRDNGVGFDMEYVHKLFGVFQRLHKECEFEGTGVGLALVRRIVERHGGRIWADSTLGEGAVFEFALPIEERVHG